MHLTFQKKTDLKERDLDTVRRILFKVLTLCKSFVKGSELWASFKISLSLSFLIFYKGNDNVYLISLW